MGKEKELQRLLKFIEQLTVPENYSYEWIIVTDTKYSQSEYSNILFVERQFGSVSELRNAGAAYAKGEYLSFVDVDMIFSTDFLENIIIELQNHSKKVFFSTIYMDLT